jgi:hypothetical protein
LFELPDQLYFSILPLKPLSLFDQVWFAQTAAAVSAPALLRRCVGSRSFGIKRPNSFLQGKMMPLLYFIFCSRLPLFRLLLLLPPDCFFPKY